VRLPSLGRAEANVSWVRVVFDERGEIVEYQLAPVSSLAAALERQLRRDDEIKHRLRLAGIDPAALSLEERQRRVVQIARRTG
jgi:hypothetical protein